MILEYKVREGAIVPTRANPSDAGLDVFYNPPDPNVTVAKIEPGENKMFPTGLSFGVPHGYMLQVCNRSSMGAKRSLIVGAHIIDSGYDGEVFVDLHNIGAEDQFVERGAKIAQLILVPVVHFRARQVTHDLYRESITISSRGEGSLGSTGDDGAVTESYAEPRDRDMLGQIHPAKTKKTTEDWQPGGF